MLEQPKLQLEASNRHVDVLAEGFDLALWVLCLIDCLGEQMRLS